jgi:hypothetical protein
VIWARATAAVLLVAFCFGLFFGRDTVSSENSLVGDSRILLGISYFFNAALTYVLAMLVAVSYQQAAYQNNAWRNVFRDNWSRWLPQVLAVFVLSAFAAVVCVVGSNIYATIGAVGIDLVLEKWGAVLRYAIEYQGPSAMRGPVLAVMVLLIIDAWRSGRRSARALDLLPLMTGAVMFATGFLTRALSSQVASRGSFDLAGSLPVLVQTGMVAGLIGLTVGLLVRATLVHEFARAVDVEADEDPPAQPQAAE